MHDGLPFQPNRKQLRMPSGSAATIPVYCRLLDDQLTPVGAYLRLSQRARHSFLLESVVGGERVARYSFVGAGPRSVLQAFGQRVRVHESGARGPRELDTADPLTELESAMKQLSVGPAGADESMRRFTGGAVGYAAYDLIRSYERLGRAPADDRGLPDLEFGIYDTMIVFDHVSRTILIVSHAHVRREGLTRGYDAACRRIRAVLAALRRPIPARSMVLQPEPAPLPRFTSNLDRPRFEQAVRDAIEYIRAGDIFQVVLSQRLRAKTAADPFDIYRALRIVNPSPFMFHVRGPSCTLIGASPEILCRVEDAVVTSRPLAGTRRRGRDEAEDLELEAALRADPKDRAEHIMLLDLARNDVGRVAQPGSIALTDVMSVERYSHVMHLSSTVRGRLAAGKTAFDALRATLPVGTVSGAPKVRAMQIIDQFEPTRRGPYGGAVGYFDARGNMDTCIALRTLVVTEPRGSRPSRGKAKKSPKSRSAKYIVDIQAGAGIVADSVPAAEYEETMNKAQALLAAVGLTERTTQRQ